MHCTDSGPVWLVGLYLLPFIPLQNTSLSYPASPLIHGKKYGSLYDRWQANVYPADVIRNQCLFSTPRFATLIVSVNGEFNVSIWPRSLTLRIYIKRCCYFAPALSLLYLTLDVTYCPGDIVSIEEAPGSALCIDTVYVLTKVP